jgi:hypothetical protein
VLVLVGNGRQLEPATATNARQSLGRQQPRPSSWRCGPSRG